MFLQVFQVLYITFVSSSVAISKKPKLAVPAGLLKGFVPAAISRRSKSSSVANSAASGHEAHDNTTESDIDFKMGGLENLDEDGNEVADKNYPKYANIKTEGKRGFQVRVSVTLSKYLCIMVNGCRLA